MGYGEGKGGKRKNPWSVERRKEEGHGNKKDGRRERVVEGGWKDKGEKKCVDGKVEKAKTKFGTAQNRKKIL